MASTRFISNADKVAAKLEAGGKKYRLGFLDGFENLFEKIRIRSERDFILPKRAKRRIKTFDKDPITGAKVQRVRRAFPVDPKRPSSITGRLKRHIIKPGRFSGGLSRKFSGPRGLIGLMSSGKGSLIDFEVGLKPDDGANKPGLYAFLQEKGFRHPSGVRVKARRFFLPAARKELATKKLTAQMKRFALSELTKLKL